MRFYILYGLLLCTTVDAQIPQDAAIVAATDSINNSTGDPCVKKDIILDIVNNMIELTREALHRVQKLADLAKGDNCVGCCQKVPDVVASVPDEGAAFPSVVTALPVQEMGGDMSATTTMPNKHDLFNFAPAETTPLSAISNVDVNQNDLMHIDDPTAPELAHIESMLNEIPSSEISMVPFNEDTQLVYDILHRPESKPVLYPMNRPSIYDLNIGRLILSKPKKKKSTSRAWDSFLVMFQRLIPKRHLDLENGLVSKHVLNAFKEYEKSINGYNTNDPNKIYLKIADIRRRLLLLK